MKSLSHFAAALFLILIAGVFVIPVFAAEPCPSREVRTWTSLINHYDLPEMTFALSFATAVDPAYPVDLYLEVERRAPHAESDRTLYLETNGQKVAIEDGAHLRFNIGEYTRLSFTVSDGSSVICTATPDVRNVGAAKRPKGPDLSNALRLLPIHIIGDAIAASTPPDTPVEEAFQIDNQVMRPLFRNGRLVLLRDPNPVTGVRTIQSPLGRATSLFLAVSLTPRKFDDQPPTQSLSISVAGLEELRHPIDLYLFNAHRDQLQANCGANTRSSRKVDGFELRVLRISPRAVRDGKFQTTCAIKVFQPGQNRLWTAIDSTLRTRRTDPERPF